ncbi:MAG: ribonuclease D [Ectothiorhodospiraceae bacterium]|jgi:ribonuclease D|nr:ribonuclease D [Ectothiorhodospiraceae bacterium]
MSSFTYVDTAAALDALCSRLEGRSWLTLDTEFIREKTYYPRLCLIQIADASEVACIDPLAIEDLTPLRRLLYDTRTLKVLHAAGQDMEIFHHLWGELPGPVFDTQIAAAVLGYGDQIGYGRLVQAVLGLDLEKAHARSDWDRRPLDPEQLNYAADDVHHLREVYLRLSADLERLGRGDWLSEDFAALSDPASYRPDPASAWRRVKGLQHLKGVQLAVLAALADWREREAMRADRPRRWILADEPLLEIAKRQPADPTALGRIRGVEEGTLRRHGQALLDCVTTAKRLPREQWPTLEPRRRLSPEQDVIADAAMALLKYCAESQAISPAALATRRDVEALVAGEDSALHHGWRAHLAGDEIAAWLTGATALAVRDGRLAVLPGTSAGAEK